MNQKFKKYFPPLIGILAVFAVWYIVCRAGILSSYVLPSPGGLPELLQNAAKR